MLVEFPPIGVFVAALNHVNTFPPFPPVVSNSNVPEVSPLHKILPTSFTEITNKSGCVTV